MKKAIFACEPLTCARSLVLYTQVSVCLTQKTDLHILAERLLLFFFIFIISTTVIALFSL